ncbi:glucoside xylosyltransferase 1-like isoform X3 [Portunus trituberculatus]|uniref:glucoside xylosyltransferase 1-like isoform X3 n=1 Tax=Portunus trituberculatus TaxID=210409 RepID=UPI001E1CE051|nr:glucoside xylosyltransferase 1-like isoform X3 [Portunus trituberculatus]
MRLLQKVLYVLALLIMTVQLRTWLQHKSLPAPLVSQAITGDPEFAIVVCRSENDKPNKAHDFQRQLSQISVLLKSAATLTSQNLTFNIVADSYATYETVANLTASWPAAYRQRIAFSKYKQVFYPPGTEKMKNLFRPCATGKLFLAQTLEDKDAVVFLDTDTLFLKPPEMLWRTLYDFNPYQVIGIAPCLYYYGRHFKITTAQQLYQLGCEWNYRPKLCSHGYNKCSRAKQLGVGLLHGAAVTFIYSIERKFKTIFEVWKHHQIGESETALLERLKTTLSQQNSRGCSRVSFIDKILLQGMENTVRRRN